MGVNNGLLNTLLELSVLYNIMIIDYSLII
jgi:hypothetical protein